MVIHDRTIDLSDVLKRQEESNTRRLFKNNKVEWHSDDYDYDEKSILTIEKLNFAMMVVDIDLLMFYLCIYLIN